MDLKPHDWFNFAWNRCTTCSRVRVASCQKHLRCVPSVFEKNHLQCSNINCDECYLSSKENDVKEARCSDCETTKIEIFKAQVEEVTYLNSVFPDQEEEILHSMIFCPLCRSVGFPGSETHLTIHGGSKGQELMHTNPTTPGKLGIPTNWKLVHAPTCVSRTSRNEVLPQPKLFTIFIDRKEASKFQGLVTEKNALSMNEASLCAMELSTTRHTRRQHRLEQLWNSHVSMLEHVASPMTDLNNNATTTTTARRRDTDVLDNQVLKPSELITIFAKLRKLVIEGYKTEDKHALIDIVRRVRCSGNVVYNENVSTSFGRLIREVIKSERFG